MGAITEPIKQVNLIKIFIDGPEVSLNDVQKQQLEKQIFTISNDNNRMGYRLNETIDNELSSILTSAVLPRTVQLTPSGKLIILMRDCQVTGGYPRILQLTETSINHYHKKQLINRLSLSRFLFELRIIFIELSYTLYFI
ncbi:hypothetical protein [Tenacibaculum sp. 1_MG-2023]|uniref:hypothetical protein n=1 Tax=Tenacibaculum sp. 1_MG-2023 TaxID=3062653 RepID=UPI0038B5D4A1